MALRKHKTYSREDVSAALIMTSMMLSSGSKRPADYQDVSMQPGTQIQLTVTVDPKDVDSVPPKKKLATNLEVSAIKASDANVAAPPLKWILKPAPYFYYNDRSCEPDDDPLIALTPPGLLPTFPAKMHAILSDNELSDVIEWLPHGRAWRILNPRILESVVLPKYFYHNKLSSFIRQTNGWGFRRLTQGYDRNAYYHEYFLRDMPYLSKKMVRPKVAGKKSVDPDHEPDFYAISREFPLPPAKQESKPILHWSQVPSPLGPMNFPLTPAKEVNKPISLQRKVPSPLDLMNEA